MGEGVKVMVGGEDGGKCGLANGIGRGDCRRCLHQRIGVWSDGWRTVWLDLVNGAQFGIWETAVVRPLSPLQCCCTVKVTIPRRCAGGDAALLRAGCVLEWSLLVSFRSLPRRKEGYRPFLPGTTGSAFGVRIAGLIFSHPSWHAGSLDPHPQG